MKYKKGITMMSIIIYVIIFFALIILATSISTNMNYGILSDKGRIYANEEFTKLQYNLFKSAKASQSVTKEINKIVFSNNDEYVFNSENKTILKNGNVLVDNVDKFELKAVSDIDLDSNLDYISYTVTFSKYKQVLNRDIFISVGGSDYE